MTISMHCWMLSSDRTAVTLGERVARSASAAASLKLPELSSQPSSENTQSSSSCSSMNQASTSSTVGHFLPFPFPFPLHFFPFLHFFPPFFLPAGISCSSALEQVDMASISFSPSGVPAVHQ